MAGLGLDPLPGVAQSVATARPSDPYPGGRSPPAAATRRDCPHPGSRNCRKDRSGPCWSTIATGASGLIAADLLAKAPPDGTTLMVAAQTTYAVAPILYKSATFDAQRDVAGVGHARRLATGAGRQPVSSPPSRCRS